jgi:hypothetical protein
MSGVLGIIEPMDTKPRLRSPKRLCELMRLRVPYALSAQRRIVLAGEVEQAGQLICPACLKPVLLRHSSSHLPHFEHAGPSTCKLEGVGWIEHSAKRALFGAVRRWLDGDAQAPKLVRRCVACGAETAQALPSDLQDAIVDRRLADGSAPDLALQRASQRLAAVVMVSSPQSEHRVERDWPAGVVVLRLDAEEALRAPERWRPRSATGLRPWLCLCQRPHKPAA